MKFIYQILFIVTIITIASCRDDFHFEPSNGTELSFSKDTVYLDTIFSNIGSSTYNLKVYNKSNKDIKIPIIRLAKGETSNFRLMVDGIPGKSFENIELLANDSMFVFIETTVDIKNETNGKDFLYTDQLIFQAGNNQQKVDLVTLVKDAIFLYPQKFEDGTYESIPINDEQYYGFFLNDNDQTNGNELNWTNEKPYVIYGFAAVPPNKTLNINQGAEIHFHSGSALVTFPTSTIHTEGSINNPIIFQGDRLEPSFEDTPGQWFGIIIGQNSNATFKNTIIKNAFYGCFINANNATVNLENVQIYNCEEYGLLLSTANVNGKNVVINNCGKASVLITYGGTYDFTHCTFANFWSRQNQTVIAMDNGDGKPEFALQAHFKNSIVYGNASESIIHRPALNSNNYNFKFDTCVIKFLNANKIYDTNNYPYLFSNTINYNNCLIAQKFNEFQPNFKNTSKNQMIITDKATDYIAKGNLIFTQQVPFDLSGKSRLSNPDLGAYQHVSSDAD